MFHRNVHRGSNLEFDAGYDSFGLQLLHVSVNTELVDGPHSRSGNTQGYEFTGLRNEKLFRLDVRDEAALRLTVGVGYVVAADWLLTR